MQGNRSIGNVLLGRHGMQTSRDVNIITEVGVLKEYFCWSGGNSFWRVIENEDG